MKRHLIIYSLLLILFNPQLKGQSPDRFRVKFDFSVGVLPVKLSGPMNVGKAETNIASIFPVYRHVDTTAFALSSIMHFGLNIPFYRNDSWSVGVELNAGVGYQRSIRAAKGMTAYVFDFPQYAYYRNYKTNLDYSILVGYKYTIAPLRYHLMLAAFDFHLSEDHGLRVYGSLFRYKYYMLLSNGDMRPMVKIGEFGLAYTYNF